MQYSGAQILIESLIEQGVDTIFGYPGASVLHIYDELYRQKNRIRHILVSHEQHAAHAADGYARSSGRVGVCLATSGPGATNLVTGIAAAAIDSVPLVAITGNVSVSLLGKDSFQEVDIAGITMPIVKHNWIVKDVNELAETIREAFIVARSGRPGPVLVDIPKDIAALSAEWDRSRAVSAPTNGIAARLAGRSRRETFNAGDIEKAAALIIGAKRPMFYAGGGVILSGADAELKKIAERLNAPVALSLMGMGAFPHDHRLCTGLIGMHGTAASNKASQKSDLLIALGARFSDRVTSQVEKFARSAKILHIDIDPAEINKNIQADAFITGDLKTVLSHLIRKIPEKMKTEWNGEIEAWKESSPKDYHRKTALHPRFVIQECARALEARALEARALGGRAIAVTDVGQHQIWTAQFFPFNRPRSFISSGGMGAMGFGMGAAIGAKIANPDCPVALFTGDGCFRMNCAEMATLVHYKLPVLIIIFNNQTLGMVRQWQNFFYGGRYSETDLGGRGPDFIKLADAYNVPAFRAVDEVSFLDSLKKCLAHNAAGIPTLIETIIDKDERVLPMVPGGRPIDEQIM
ncbi:MAG: biosynthetic-type acetolactate synthase large subunit [Treponema sp.]|jgi:acetolactate synthase-1/2/3 large subunit|nr:biosynthetic-type acetolactate synthase large subunit [Treponema sp.]